MNSIAKTQRGIGTVFGVLVAVAVVGTAGLVEAAAIDGKCAGPRRRLEKRTLHQVRVCEARATKVAARGGSFDLTACVAARWANYDTKLANRDCFGRPLLAAPTSQAAGADDLALADTDAIRQHLALRGAVADVKAVIDRLGPDADEATAHKAVLRYAKPAAEAAQRFVDAEDLVRQVEKGIWSSFVTAWEFPSVVADPLEVAMAQFQVELRRLLGPSFRTDIPSLASQHACRGDVIGDRLIERYGRAVVQPGGGDDAAVEALRRLAAQLACLSNSQASLLDIALVDAYDRVVARLERAGLGPVIGAFTRIVAPIELLVLDTVKHKGEGAFAWRWFVQHADVLDAQVSRLGWPTGDVVWLYDRIDARLIGFPHCADGESGDGRCVDQHTLLRSVRDPRALGLGDCALSGMVARGPSDLGGTAAYACPSVPCGTDAISAISPTIGTFPIDSRLARPSIGTTIGSSLGRLPWSGLTRDDVAAMRGACDGGTGAGGGDDGGAQGPAGGRGDWGGAKECFDEALGEASGPFERWARCVTDGLEPSRLPELGTDHQGVPMDKRCGLMDGDGGEEEEETPPPPPPGDDEKTDETPTEPEEGLASKLWNAVTTVAGAVANRVAGAALSVEAFFLDPKNAQTVVGTTEAIIRNRIELMYASGDLSAHEYEVLSKMKAGDAAEYLKHKKGGGMRSCAVAEECDANCTGLNTQLAERRTCDQQLMDETLRPGGDLDPLDPLINPGPEGPVDGDIGGVMGCLLDQGGNGTDDVNLKCGLVTCADGLATAFSGAQCCAAAGIVSALPIDLFLAERVCTQVQCADGMASVMDGGGACGCGLATPGGGGVPAPDPGPSPVDDLGLRDVALR